VAIKEKEVSKTLGSKGKKHLEKVLERFYNGKLLRSSDGTRLHPRDPKDEARAKAIAFSEARAGEERGFVKREWKGSKRVRPRKAK